MNSDDLSWVAGFLEGEDYFLVETSARGYIRVRIGANSTDLDIVERLHGLVPGSTLAGPYKPGQGSFGEKEVWRWTLHARLLVVELAKQLRPLMGERRKGQIDLLLEHHATRPIGRNRYPSPAEHGTRTRYGSGCKCQPCRIAENTYQRDRRAARKLASA